jgi:hypothetical protein
MNKIIITLVFIASSMKFCTAQIKFGSNGIGYSIFDKNQFAFRINPNKLVGKKKELSAEIQFNKTIYHEELNKFYCGVGIGYTWVNLHEIASGSIIRNDYNLQQLFIPIGIEYFPLENKKISFQVEVRPQIEITKFELNPDQKLSVNYYPKVLIEINYYFREN